VRSRTLLESSRNAVHGLLHVLRCDWHMRFICLLGAGVMLLSALARVSRLEVLLLTMAICLVAMAEIINRAVEVVVDMVRPRYHPMAKVAKDVGSAGVLAAIIFGVIVVVGVFINTETLRALQGIGDRPPPHFLHVGLVGIVTVVSAIILGKVWGGHGTLTRGGLVSAHSALGFFCFVTIWFLTPDIVVRGLSLALAALVAQSRVDAGIHSVREVLIGVVVALVVGAGLYGILAMRAGA
jgi:diacylglycerol kinase (ATP)